MCPPVKQNKLQLICEKFYDVPFLQLNQSLFILKHISNYSYQWESIFWEWRIRLEDGWDCLNNMERTQLSVNWYWWTFSREMGLKQGHTGTRCVCLMSCSQRRTTAKSDTVLCAQRPPHGARVKLGRIWLRAAPWKQSCPCPVPRAVTCQSRAVLPQLTTLKPAPAGSPCSHSSVTWQPQAGQLWVLTEQTVLLWALPLNRPWQPSNCRVTLSWS